MASKWFAVRTFYRSDTRDRPVKPDKYYDLDVTMFEERVLLVKAKDKKEAAAKTEKEAWDYARFAVCENPCEQKIATRYLGYYDIFELEKSPDDKTEVFVTTRLVSRRVKDSKVVHVYGTPKEGRFDTSRRKKFLNQDYRPKGMK